jgi:hypothetical protein
MMAQVGEGQGFAEYAVLSPVLQYILSENGGESGIEKLWAGGGGGVGGE